MGIKVIEAQSGEPSSGWLLAAEAHEELESRALQETAALLGKVTLTETVELGEAKDEEGTTLLEALERAAEGDKESAELVRINVAKDVSERIFKVANISKVKINKEGGRFTQNGRRLGDIYANPLRYTYLNEEMQKRSKRQVTNVFLAEALADQSVLDTHYFAVFELAPTNEETKRDFNFFEDTDSFSAQLFDLRGDEGILETALVAGKPNPSAERQDIRIINELMRTIGLPALPLDASDSVSHVVLIPKAAAPNGISDVVRMYDDAAGGTFFGENKERKDYQTYAAWCEEREARFDDIVQRITNQLIYDVEALDTPLQAIERLDYLSERLTVSRAVKDTAIDARVFGARSALHIEEARFFHERGETERAVMSERKAQQTANSSSCPLYKNEKDTAEIEDQNAQSNQEEDSKTKWMNCPHCSAKVYDDPCATVLACWDCKAMVVGGNVISKGNGGGKKRRKEVQAKKQAKQKELAKINEANKTARKPNIEVADEIKQQTGAKAGKLVAAAGVLF